MDKTFHFILNYNGIIIFVFFKIEVYFINFSQKFRICAFFVFFVATFWGSQIIP